MEKKLLTNRTRDFKTKLLKAADKFQTTTLGVDKRAFERNWTQVRRCTQLWGEIARSW